VAVQKPIEGTVIYDIFVHKYKWSHSNKRKKYRKMLKNKEVKLVRSTKEGFYYKKVLK